MITYEINILCDGEGCKETAEVLTCGPVTAESCRGAVVEEMSLNQWSELITNESKHYCPKCFIIERDRKKGPQ